MLIGMKKFIDVEIYGNLINLLDITGDRDIGLSLSIRVLSFRLCIGVIFAIFTFSEKIPVFND